MNNLKELFEIQAGLDAEILNNHPIQPGEDRLEKKHAALLVELGEMFNEWRAFKFWSHDKKPRTNVKCKKCHGLGEILYFSNKENHECEACQGTGEQDYVLKELVDCLHFVLSIGLELDPELNIDELIEKSEPYISEINSIENQFIQLMMVDWSTDGYEEGFDIFIGLSERLGYTWEQVTEAYLAKNQENHYRQMNGY